jgi:hypothetical protein
MSPAHIPASPVIVMGMHRSGTTMLARLLSSAGVFMGHQLTTNFESMFFQWLNRDILDPLGCSWARLEDLPEVGVLFEKFTTMKRIVGDRLTRGLVAEHFGGGPVGESWGWKDPRTCLTLPFFQGFFPDARIVFIYRDPRDVAMSLLTRHERAYDKSFRLGAADAQARFTHYLALWDEYNRRALEGMAAFRSVISVRSEDFVESPRGPMHDILTMLTLPPTREMEQQLAEVRLDRARAFEQAGDDRLRGITFDSPRFTSWYGASTT